MITNDPRWILRITHEPTGIVLEADANCFRSQYAAREYLISRLKSKLWCMQNEDSPTYGYIYDIGDNEFVDDLTEYRRKYER